jgi:short-subunit dehydrogenase
MKKVIVIGATSGIGRKLATIYLENNYLVGATGRRLELLQSLQKEYPEKVIIESFDVRADNAVENFERLIKKMEGLDLLIYNSGYGDVSEKLDWEIEKRTYETNVKGFIAIVNRAFNYFVEQGHGQIAATSSIASIRGAGQAPAYGASKAFMSTYMEGLYLKASKLRTEDGRKVPIFITDIQPGFVATKQAKADKLFWVAPVEKAARQIYQAIERKKRRAYITRRWALVAWLLRWMPFGIYRRIV